MKRFRKLIISMLTVALLSAFCIGQEGVYTYTSDPVYPTMAAPVTIYVNVLSEDVLNPAQTIDTDSTVTAYTGLITSLSAEPGNDWRNIVNTDWSDISLEMVKENDSIYSFTIADPTTFYGVDPSTKSVYRIAFIARGTSNGQVDGQTRNLYFEVFDSEPVGLLATQPAEPYASESVVITLNSEQSEDILGYTDTLYAYSGLVTTSSTSDSDWKFILEDWEVNNSKTRMLQVSDSIYRYYIYPDIHGFYDTEEAENIEKMGFIFRTKEDPYQQTPELYIDVTDTLTIQAPEGFETTETNIAPGIEVYPNPALDMIYIHLQLPVQGEVAFRIFDLQGKTIYESRYTVSEEKTLQVNLKDIPGIRNGLFLYSVETDDLKKTSKLLINN
ncbi:MAG: T9SS type A sorting domain-containing protein [Bacteroidales bacterium]|nr:T9SS type A sorting domain-containing protein [Bacteroidales bacterium]